MDRLISILGVFSFLSIAFLLSTNRRKLNWRLVIIGTLLTWAFALLALGIPAANTQSAPNGKKVLSWIYDKFKTKKGCTSYFGESCLLNHGKKQGYPHKPYIAEMQ